jgi:hypothetical protein
MEGKMRAKLIDAALFLLIALMVVSYVAMKEKEGASAHAAQLQAAPLHVTLYVGKDCLQPSGEIEDRVLTNDDADERLQHCSGGVTWKELRRE